MQQGESFPGQPSGEVTRRVVYKHFMAIAPVLIALVIIIVALLTLAAVYNTNQLFLEQFISKSLIGLVGFSMISFIALLFFGTIWIWRRNRIIITNYHIVDIDQIGFFNRSVSTLRLEEIQDISAKIHGPLQSILGYGTIIIQTAGEKENFVFDFVPQPYDIERDILEARKAKYSQKN